LFCLDAPEGEIGIDEEDDGEQTGQVGYSLAFGPSSASARSERKMVSTRARMYTLLIPFSRQKYLKGKSREHLSERREADLAQEAAAEDE
jgi:hypothetical protein